MMNDNQTLPRTLALDTSTPWLTLTLGNRNEVIYQYHSQVIADHSRILIQSLQEIQKKGFFSIYQPERIVIGRGPGSFTGIKITNITGRTLAYSLNCPLYGFSTLEMLAYQGSKRISFHDNLILLPVILHKKNEVFWSEFQSNFQKQLDHHVKIQMGPYSDIINHYSSKNVLIITPWQELYSLFQAHQFQCLHPDQSQPDAMSLIELVESRETHIPKNHSEFIKENALPLYGSRVFEHE
ncbi:MAG: tRNA (adenosine(37)-N6)-threonylcarbamoyltransferase complex dimerization subunit type 1 TsaB [Candidatus Atribacteria bacterium]|nr:tRNA (adenosine(37)-N6)-threonylcarbamoyltransferase complex dimerization subunit type 1 TsaB [Candidatus Atribacteria bacterium]